MQIEREEDKTVTVTIGELKPGDLFLETLPEGDLHYVLSREDSTNDHWRCVNFETNRVVSLLVDLRVYKVAESTLTFKM